MVHKRSSHVHINGTRLRHHDSLLLVLLGMLVGLVAPAAGQTSPPQRVYVSQSVFPPSTSGVSAFNQTNQTGSLSLITGSPFGERLEGGLMAIDGQGKFLFVLNPTSNDISMFQIDATTGALSEVPASPFAVPPVSPNMSAPMGLLSITGEASGKFVFVGYENEFGTADTESAVFSLTIDTSGSSPILVPSMEVTPMSAPVALLTDSKGLHLYVGLGVAVDGALSGGGPQVFSIDPTTGDLSDEGVAPNPQNRGAFFAIDPA